MDHQFASEGVARQLAQLWDVHRTPAFTSYLVQVFGCEPLKPVQFGGVFCLQMIKKFFFPDALFQPGPLIERLWLVDDAGFRESRLSELRPVENLEDDNPFVVYNEARTSYNVIDDDQPYLFVYPRYKFCVRDDSIVYIEMFGYSAQCTKVGKIIFRDRANIQDARVTKTSWQGRPKDLGQSG